MSTLGKIVSIVLNNRLIAWAEQYDVYIEAQTGIRKGMHISDNIFVLNVKISHTLNQGGTLYCAFVDFKKPFDFINVEAMMLALRAFGIPEKMLGIALRIYTSRSFIVADGEDTSRHIPQ